MKIICEKKSMYIGFFIIQIAQHFKLETVEYKVERSINDDVDTNKCEGRYL